MIRAERFGLRDAWPRSRGAWIIVAVGVIATVAVVGTRYWWARASVPVPPHLATLEPQLRDYISENVDWVRKNPFSATRQATLGLVYIANSLYPQAYLAFSNTAKLNPKEPLARVYLAVAAEETDKMPEAERILKDVTTRFPNFAPGFYRLGEVSLRTGNPQQAEAAFQRLTVLAPQEPRGYTGLAQVRIRQNKFEAAVPLIGKAIQLDAGAKAPHYLLGLAYRGLGRMNDARIELMLGANQDSYPMPDDWSKLIPQHIKLLQDQIDMAREFEEAGEPEKAVVLLAKAYVYRTNDVGLVNNLAIALNRAGQPKKAQALLASVAKQNERYLPGQITLSYCFHAMGQDDKALAAAERAIALSPGTAQAHIAKANAFLGMGSDMEALTALEEAFRCDPKNAEIQMQIGDILWRNQSQPEEALKHYLTATNLNPVLAPVYVRLGDYYLYRGETNAAEPVVQMLRRLDPQAPELAVLEKRLNAETHVSH